MSDTTEILKYLDLRPLLKPVLAQVADFQSTILKIPPVGVPGPKVGEEEATLCFYLDAVLPGYYLRLEISTLKPCDFSLVVRFCEALVQERIRSLRPLSHLKLATTGMVGQLDHTDRFLQTISNEMRAPMSGIVGMTQLLQETRLSKKQKEYLEVLQVSSEILLRIINDFLDYNILKVEKLSLDSQAFHFGDFLKGVIKELEWLCEQKKLQAIAQLSSNLPEWVVGDAYRIRQILSHLISNAIKFTDAGSVTLVVTDFPCAVDQHCLTFEIRDTGIGLDESRLDCLFHDICHVDSEKGSGHDGMGIGLVICRQLADLMQGRIFMNSLPGLGSTFSFQVTLKNTAMPVKTSGAHDVSALEDVRILMAEDSAVNRRVLNHLLEKLGYKADMAENGIQAVEMAKTSQYDIIFLDLWMPEMDGLEAAKAIRELDKNRYPSAEANLIAMTADTMKGVREQCLASGMNDYVTKPITLDVLGESIANWSSR